MKRSIIYTLTTITCIWFATIGCLPASGKDFVLVLDAGHGGHDPGAIGNFSREKDINLNIALKVGRLIQNNNDKAYSMNTTLWFTDKVIKNGIPESLVASGQYTICWSLLRYIHQLEKSATEINETHKLIVACETQLLEDWERFQSDPMWLFKEKIQK